MEADDDPVFTVSVSGAVTTKYVYSAVTVEYDTATGIWSVDSGTDPEISVGTSVPANTATVAYVQIGSVVVVSDGGGGYEISSIAQTVSGNQWLARTGNSGTYVDANGVI